ncbi:MAG: hypothetical protein GQ474_07265 [Sulfurimonas sp.]|nr:hypothetical protein [Sulfurimonas sp.]
MTAYSLQKITRTIMFAGLLVLPELTLAAKTSVNTAAKCPSDKICMTVLVDNKNTSVPAANGTLYLTLFGAQGPTTMIKPNGSSFNLGESIKFKDLNASGASVNTAKFIIQTSDDTPFSSGRLYLSESNLSGNQPAVNVPFRYDYVEFTIIEGSMVNGDVSGIDQVGIPSKLEFQDANGSTLNNAGTKKPAMRKMGCWTDIYNAVSTDANLSNPAWDASTISILTNSGTKLRLAGPSAMPSGYAGYPSMEKYVKAMANQKVTISGYFAGNTALNLKPTYYKYTGTFDTAGNLALSGTLSSDKNGTTSNANYPKPQSIYLPGLAFYDTMANTSWDRNGTVVSYGTGFGVYGQNGPYQLGGTKPVAGKNGSWKYTQGNGVFYLSIGNDVYGWIYGDLIASMANGVLGPLGYDTSKWNTNKDASGTAYASAQKAFSAVYADPTKIPKYAAWDFWQQAVSTTSDSYGVSLGDRFNFIGAKSSSPDMSTDTNTSIIKVTLLANDGCE